MSPKRSRVDIVQATGRAMRKSEETDKTAGYVLVPLFVEQAAGETVEEAIIRSEFDEVWRVLQALQENDEVLAEIIRQMRENRGRTKGFDDGAFREKVVVLGPGLSLNSLRQCITTRIIDRLGSSMDERFGELLAYKDLHGDCNVPEKWPENLSLGLWVVNRRQDKRKGTLSDEWVRRLEAVGFVWEAREYNWEEMLSELTKFKVKHGHCNVQMSDNPLLFHWVIQQRTDRRQGIINEERIRRLDNLGFVWDPQKAAWQEHLRELAQYKDQYGDCNVPRNCPNRALVFWIMNQRQFRKRGKLSAEQISQLDELGFIWDPHEADWEEQFGELKRFKEANRHCEVPDKYPENPRLGNWVRHQRGARINNTLRADRFRRLDEIGFVWEKRDAAWEEMFSALTSFKSRFENCNVPIRWAENPKLARWVSQQRYLRKKGTLSQERIRRLDSIGFEWALKNRSLS